MKEFKTVRMMMVICATTCALSLVACSDDNDEVVPPAPVTAADMYGLYTGNVFVDMQTPTTRSVGERPKTPVEATINNDTIYFNDFPVRGLILSILGEEEAVNAIVEALGKVTYAVGYAPVVSEKGDSISFTLDPKPLTLSLQMPTGEEGTEPISMNIEVKVAAHETAGYDVKATHTNFSFEAREVLVDIGSGQMPFPFNPVAFHFDMNKEAASDR